MRAGHSEGFESKGILTMNEVAGGGGAWWSGGGGMRWWMEVQLSEQVKMEGDEIHENDGFQKSNGY